MISFPNQGSHGKRKTPSIQTSWICRISASVFIPLSSCRLASLAAQQSTDTRMGQGNGFHGETCEGRAWKSLGGLLCLVPQGWSLGGLFCSITICWSLGGFLCTSSRFRFLWVILCTSGRCGLWVVYSVQYLNVGLWVVYSRR